MFRWKGEHACVECQELYDRTKINVTGYSVHNDPVGCIKIVHLMKRSVTGIARKINVKERNMTVK